VLKITIVETATERKWVVQGRLVGPWVSELRANWKKAHRIQDKRACVIDLNDVTFIDKSGERLLRAISKKGAQLVAKGLYVKHLLEQLKSGGRRESSSSVGLMNGIDRASATNSSAGRTARTEEQ
jgi:anti-anti-sigma regulatory factor